MFVLLPGNRFFVLGDGRDFPVSFPSHCCLVNRFISVKIVRNPVVKD